MTYTAKSLPAWVRFRRRPKPLPVFTVPTLLDFQLERLMVETMLRRGNLLAERTTRDSWFTRKQEQNVNDMRRSIRVVLTRH